MGRVRVAAADSPAVHGHGGSPEAEQGPVPRRGMVGQFFPMLLTCERSSIPAAAPNNRFLRKKAS